MQVVAEGVETRAQHDFLEALGCNIGQGYFYSPAVPAASVRALLRSDQLIEHPMSVVRDRALSPHSYGGRDQFNDC
jgi:predicted signal transduction protein with EAL and GGDEF domain